MPGPGPRSRMRSLLLLSFFVLTSGQQYSYTRNCIDQHHKEVKCTVQVVDCENDLQLPAYVNDTSLVPGEAHDIRVESFAKAVARRQTEAYQLTVDISWQTPPNNSTKLLQGFFLEIESEDQKTHTCFLFNLTDSNWTSETVAASPRLHFSTESLFRFDQKYEVSVHSLPESQKLTRTAHKKVLMPHNPRSINYSNLLSPNCSKYSHPHASKWTAGFRRIALNSLMRTIEIQFVGAPPQYCFEQYEVRLLDETGLELLHSDVISVDQMQPEIIDNATVYFGQYNFSNLALNRTYIPSVIAVEKASDGRCLCPVYGTGHTHDSTVVCSCIAADSSPVKLPPVQTDQSMIIQTNGTLPTSDTEVQSTGWKIYFILIFLTLCIISCLIGLFVYAYRHYAACGKTVRIRFIQDRSRQSDDSLPNNASKALLEHSGGLVKIHNNFNVLIVYSHDSVEHDAAVLALANFLRDVFNFDVHLDVYDAEKIEMNLMDYLSSSVVNADKILIVNSMGSAQRYQAKIQALSNGGFTVERNEPTAFDSLFVSHIDMVLQHHSVVSVRFDFSSFGEVLPPLHGCLQYVLPANLTPLLSALTGTNLKSDPRLNGYSPAAERLSEAVNAQRARISANPDGWFAALHHRRPRVLPQPQTAIELPSMSTLPTVSVADEDVEVESGDFDIEAANGDRIPLMQKDVEVVTTITEVEEPQLIEEARVPPILNQNHEPLVVPTPRRSVDFEAADSGVYDDSMMFTTNEPVEQPNDFVQPIAQQTKLKKWNDENDEQMDSGLISDDVRMISAS
ncbi:SEFIR domain-containing protein [Aphelenchoides besseyi]|nr:SEFIR domain-containing protein [Aphelenchoides besseyi]KAI6224811.1 SEFIR domain-containing protein [Aphelenchoides besseyi]